MLSSFSDKNVEMEAFRRVEKNESSRMILIFWKNGLSRKWRVARQEKITPLKRHPGVWSIEDWQKGGSNEETSSGPSNSC